MKMLNRAIKGILFLLLIGGMTKMNANEYNKIVSPDGRVCIEIKIENGKAFYLLYRDNNVIINKSKLGFRFLNIPSLDSNFTIEKIDTDSFNQTWEQPWGEKRFIKNCYNEMIVHLKETGDQKRRLDVIFRAFDDGIGFRYYIPKQEKIDSVVVADEETEFKMTAIHNAWWIPVHSENSFYESLYRHTPISKIDTANTPITIETKNGLFLVIHEANLTDYASMTLLREDSSLLKCELVPWSNGVKVYGETPFVTPWRTIIIADKPGDLITSYLMLNLNDPCKLNDISWIRPSKYIGIWWGMHIGIYTWASGPKHGANTENTKMYIDFASKNNIPGVLVEGWNVGWGINKTFSYTEPYPDFEIQKICDYAASKNVELIGHNETYGAASDYESKMEDAFKMYGKMGIHTVKTGYVNKYLDGKEWHDGQYAVRHYRKVIETAAKYNIMIDNHEPVKPTGISRTYPNLMTQEGARGQEYDAWSPDGGNPPSHTTILPFTRLLAGPMDFTFGTFNFKNENNPQTRVQTTLAKQLALYVVIYSPLQMASDLPENYLGNKAFDFIKEVPCDWEDTKVINGEIGNYITIARKDRNSEEWYLGSITDENSRNLELQLTFLDPGRNYKAEIYSDGENADWKYNPTPVSISTREVDNKTVIEVVLAPGGGTAIRFIPEK
jgi:alpha-glucosidase